MNVLELELQVNSPSHNLLTISEKVVFTRSMGTSMDASTVIHSDGIGAGVSLVVLMLAAATATAGADVEEGTGEGEGEGEEEGIGEEAMAFSVVVVDEVMESGFSIFRFLEVRGHCVGG